MMVVAHGVAWQMTGIAKSRVTLLGDFVLSLRFIGNDVSWDEVKVVEILGKCVFSVTESFLERRLIRKASRRDESSLTCPGSLTQIVEHPIGASTELLLSTTFGIISSMCSKNSWWNVKHHKYVSENKMQIWKITLESHVVNLLRVLIYINR